MHKEVRSTCQALKLQYLLYKNERKMTMCLSVAISELVVTNSVSSKRAAVRYI